MGEWVWGEERAEEGRGLKNSCHRYMTKGAYYVCCQKRFFKKNMALRAQFQMFFLAC